MFNVPVQELTDFIVKAFNYYNGKINQVNYPARLEIQWANLHGSYQAAYTSLPNKLCINAQLIFNYYENNIAQIYYEILESIIHELHHMDQIIDYSRVKYDIDYVNYIECAVETQTYLYILQHQQEILEVFGIDIPKRDICRFLQLSDIGYVYHRQRYEDHVTMIFGYIFYVYNNSTTFKHIQEFLLDIMSVVSSTDASLIVSINGNQFKIQHGKQLAPIRDINDFFYNNCFKWKAARIISIDSKFINNNSVALINIIAEFGNIMATCV